MNYFFEGAFKDKEHWKKIFIIINILLAYMDIQFGFFGGYLFIFVVISGLISLLVLIIKKAKGERNDKSAVIDQRLFEGKIRAEFKSIIRENSDFQTFCFECINYNNDKRMCNISYDIINKRALKTKITGSNFEYCLYWKDKDSKEMEIENE